MPAVHVTAGASLGAPNEEAAARTEEEPSARSDEADGNNVQVEPVLGVLQNFRVAKRVHSQPALAPSSSRSNTQYLL